MRVFLVGFMGAGKSTLARLLANKLGLAHADLDTEIEAEAGLPISQLLTKSPKRIEGFRKSESDMLKHWCVKDDFVLATGGGTPIYHEGMMLMRDAGQVVYLHVPLSVAIHRIRNDHRARPLAIDISRLGHLYVNRLPVYGQAHHIIDGTSEPVELARVVAAMLTQE